MTTLDKLEIFNLWNRYLPSDDICEFDVTMANAPRIKDGTSEFLEACLKALKVPNPPCSWRIRPFRSRFYSDYTGAGEAWEDRWADGWEVRVALEGSIENLESRLAEFPCRVNAIDRSWDGMTHDPLHDSTALLISVFRDEQTARETGRMLLESVRLHGVRGTHEVSVHAFGAKRHQLRVWFSDIGFPDWVHPGDEFCVLFEQMGGIVNRRHLERLDR
jgi:hypothetical protein